MPINVQVIGSWLGESTILHVAALLESVSTVRGLHPTLRSTEALGIPVPGARLAMPASMTGLNMVAPGALVET